MSRPLVSARISAPVSAVLAALAFASLAAGCGGAVADEGGPPGVDAPPPQNTRFALRVDGKPVGLGPATGSRFELTRDGVGSSFITVTADETPRTGDAIRGAGVTLFQPFGRGSFDCTPSPSGETPTSAGAALSPGPFFGFTPTLRDCVVVVEYVSPERDRVVGRFSANGLAPANSSLSGKVSVVEGEFDVEVKPVRVGPGR